MNQTDTISPMELMGALSGLLIHDLSNHISVISGNAQFTQMLASGSEKISRTAEAMVRASKAATHTLVGFGGFRKSIYSSDNFMDASGLEEAISKASSGWDYEFEGPVSGRVAFDFRWAVHSVAQVRELIGAESGKFEITQFDFDEIPDRPGRRFRGCPATKLVEIKVSYSAETPFDFMEIRKGFEKIELLAAYEMVHACGGWIDSYTVSEGKQAIAIYLPIEDEESAGEKAEAA